jgi:hypothetical protein
MKTPFTTFAAISGFSLILGLTGCVTDESSLDETQDGGNIVFAQEGKSMASVIDGSAGAHDIYISGNDTLTNSVTLEKVFVPLHFDATCGCYVRSTRFTNTVKGFGRSRMDSIWLFTNGIARTDSFRPYNADSIVYVRHVLRIDGYSNKPVDVTTRTTLVRKSTDSGTVYVWTGTVSGTFKGKELSGSSYTLVRHFSPGNFPLSNGFGVPLGHMLVKRGQHDCILTFNADGTVTVTVKRGNKFIRTTHIDNDDHES